MKLGKYLDLAIEIKALWKLKKVETIPVVIRSLGTIQRGLEGNL